MNEEKKRLQGAYDAMLQSEAWRDLVRWAETQRDASIQKQDTKSAADLNINIVCEDRGIRKGIAMVIRSAEQKREGI